MNTTPLTPEQEHEWHLTYGTLFPTPPTRRTDIIQALHAHGWTPEDLTAACTDLAFLATRQPTTLEEHEAFAVIAQVATNYAMNQAALVATFRDRAVSQLRHRGRSLNQIGALLQVSRQRVSEISKRRTYHPDVTPPAPK